MIDNTVYDVKVGRAALDVLVERQRQITEEGWTEAHDDEHDGGEMAFAAGCYALAGAFESPSKAYLQSIAARYWMWVTSWWKPTDRRRNLVKSAALTIAEIERLDRAEAKAK